ncbi:hypothetical protein, partial [Rhizobium sp. RU20A]|uniref:hypothetical protein n=1 Tax=Rhizobium sp. RU20A TaxID=1907412 RepID=UPI001AEE8A4A
LFVRKTVALHSLVLSMGQSLLQNGLVQRGKVTDKASEGQVQFDNPRIATMNTGRAAFGTPATSGLTMCGDDDHIGSVIHCLHVQLGLNRKAENRLAWR